MNSLYTSTKGLVCCTVSGTAGTQWLAMLTAGCLTVAASCFLFVYIGRLDSLPLNRRAALSVTLAWNCASLQQSNGWSELSQPTPRVSTLPKGNRRVQNNASTSASCP